MDRWRAKFLSPLLARFQLTELPTWVTWRTYLIEHSRNVCWQVLHLLQIWILSIRYQNFRRQRHSQSLFVYSGLIEVLWHACTCSSNQVKHQFKSVHVTRYSMDERLSLVYNTLILLWTQAEGDFVMTPCRTVSPVFGFCTLRRGLDAMAMHASFASWHRLESSVLESKARIQRYYQKIRLCIM